MRTQMFLLFAGLAIRSMASAAETGPTVSHLTCEGSADPALVDTASPRFSWWLVDPVRGARQTAYQLRVTPLRADGRPSGGAIETPRTNSDQSQWVTVPQWVAQPGTRYTWQVRVWDERGRDSGWSKPATFETGLLGGAWPAAWVGDGVKVARAATPGARYFRQEFTAATTPVKARLYLSAFGLVEPWLNGRKVTADLFLPGWPDYQKRVFYVTYDVTAQVRAGANALGLVLGDGWYSGTLMTGAQAGPQPLVSAWLELTDAAGRVTVVKTGPDTRWTDGPVTAQGIYFGETYDARRADPRWSAAQMAGPATTGALMVMGAEDSGTQRIIGCLGVVVAAAAIGSVLLLAGRLERLLGRNGIAILSKLTGLVLAAMAAQMLFTGVRALLFSEVHAI